MPIYISLVSFTEQDVKNFHDTVRRAEDARGLIEQHGGQLRQIFWTLGEYDLVSVAEFPTTRPPPPYCCRSAPSATSARRP
jgi:uncharacterized protein with GYD domain